LPPVSWRFAFNIGDIPRTADHRREAIVTHVTAGELVPEQAHRARHRKPDELAILPVGDEDGRSYEDLYVEHAPAARAVALSMVPRDVADDIVAEAFTRVLKAIRAGGGPGLAFRAYLLTAVRNTANDWLRASRRVTAVGDVENDLEDRVPEENLGLARLSRGPEAEAEARIEAQLVARAFSKLPARWQAVLWQLEVEARAPAAVAPGFGLSANGVSALAVRAREGLRQAYLAEHVGANIPDACRAYAEALSADTRGRLSRRRQAAVHDHLTQCQSCHSLAGELTELNSRLGAILTPALLVMAMGATGHELMGLAPATGAKVAAGTKAAAGGKAAAGTTAAAGAKAGAGAKAAAGAKTVLATQWRVWRLHPLAAAATATAGLAAAGGMVFAVSVSPMSPFQQSTQPVTERPAAAAAQVSEPALGRSGSSAGSAAGQAAGTGSSAVTSAAPGGLVLPSGTDSTDGTGGQVTDGQAGGSPAGSGSGQGTGDAAAPSASASPVRSLVGGVAATGEAVVGGLGTTVQGATSGLGDTVQGVTSGLGDTVQGVTGGVGSTVQGVTSGLGDTVQGVTGGVGSTVQGVTSGLGGTVQGTTGALGSTVQSATAGVGSVVQGAASGAGATVAGVGQTVNGVTQGLGSTVNQTTTGLGNIISGTTAAISGGNPALTAVGNAAGSLVQGVGGAADGATGAVGDTVGGATAGVGNVTSGVGAAANNVVSGTGAAANNVVSGTGAAANGVVSGVGSAANGVVSGTGAAANGVVSGVGSAANGVVSGTGAAANGVVSGVGSTTNGLVSGAGAGVSGLLGGGKS
jgi:RNA polymerase sigma factor (sigma-70 family)